MLHIYLFFFANRTVLSSSTRPFAAACFQNIPNGAYYRAQGQDGGQYHATLRTMLTVAVRLSACSVLDLAVVNGAERAIRRKAGRSVEQFEHTEMEAEMIGAEIFAERRHGERVIQTDGDADTSAGREEHVPFVRHHGHGDKTSQRKRMSHNQEEYARHARVREIRQRTEHKPRHDSHNREYDRQ